MTTKKEHLEHIAKLVQEGKQKLMEAANYAAEHEVGYRLDLFGTEHYLENLDYWLDGEDEDYLEEAKQEMIEKFGVSKGYVWATSSTFC
jgi:hypothetical protein